MTTFDTFLIIFFGSFLASFFQRYIGFAYGLIALTLWINFIDTKVAIVLSLFGAFVGQCINFHKNKKKEIKSVRFFLLGGILGMLLGFLGCNFIDLAHLKTGLGVIMLLFFLVNTFISKASLGLKNYRLGEFLAGGLGGGLGVFGAGFGMVPSLWCTMNRYDKDAYLNIMIFFNLLVIIFSFFFHLQGFVGSIEVYYFLIVLFSFFVSDLFFNYFNFEWRVEWVRMFLSFVILLQGGVLIFNIV